MSTGYRGDRLAPRLAMPAIYEPGVRYTVARTRPAGFDIALPARLRCWQEVDPWDREHGSP